MDGHWFLVFGVWNPAVDRLPQTHQLAQTPKSISAFVKLPLRVSYISNKSDPDECIVQRERERETTVQYKHRWLCFLHPRGKISVGGVRKTTWTSGFVTRESVCVRACVRACVHVCVF